MMSGYFFVFFEFAPHHCPSIGDFGQVHSGKHVKSFRLRCLAVVATAFALE